MATYTIELGKLLTLDGFDIGMKDYPLPSFLHSAGDMQTWREALNQKIINHYYFNEICCLPPDRFKLFLNITLNEKMPYFNLLYDAMAENGNSTLVAHSMRLSKLTALVRITGRKLVLMYLLGLVLIQPTTAVYKTRTLTALTWLLVLIHPAKC